MKHLKLFEDWLNEDKSVGTLYHSLDPESLLHVLTSDRLESWYHRNQVSLTRNRNYTDIIGMDKYYKYKLVLDGDKLSTRYKIFPIADKSNWVKQNRVEAEERIVGPVKELHKYLEEIWVIDYGKDDPGYYGREDESKIIEMLWDFSRRHRFPIKTQDAKTGKVSNVREPEYIT